MRQLRAGTFRSPDASWSVCWAWALAIGVTAAAVVFPPVAVAHDGKLTFAPVLEQATPAVVSIRVDLRRRGPWSSSGSSGSGVIIDADQGHVVTNHHVIRGAEKVTVALEDRREFEAQLVGSDPGTDIALLKIDADGLKALPLGDSDELQVGDFVVAIGNPFDLGQTVTSGIVSALGRSGFSDGYEDFIQTDASINRGNSGGALVDLEGRLVGINSVIVSPSGVSAGLGFAVPANIVRTVTGQIVEYGSVRRGQLGVMIQDLSPDAVDVLGLEAAKGVIVADVVDGSAAEAAGIQSGDVVLSLDDEEVVSASDLRTRVGLANVGDEVELVVLRDGKRKAIEATIGTAEDAEGLPRPSMSALAGVRLRDLPRGHWLFGEVRGVEVTAVEGDSRAWLAGLRRGDVILAVNRRAVDGVAEFEAAVEDLPQFAMLVQRGDRRFFVFIR